jgi:small Trp-rich protein
MYFLGLGLILMALKFFEIEPVAQLNWLWVLSPFALAVAWWAWADSFGYTQKKSMQREEARKQARIDRQREALAADRKPRV